MKLSVVLPVHNEKENINQLYTRLKKILNKLTPSHEIIFVNDGSTDGSLQLIKSVRKSDKKVKIISFSRNFGHMAAVTAGLKHASGQKVVVMDADLQDPPVVINKLYKKSQKYDVIFAVKKQRKESFLMRLLFSLFYLIQTRISALPIPANAGTFSILDRKVVSVLNSLPEKNKFFSGLRVWSGFSQTSIEYKRAARYAGQKKAFHSLVSLALDGIFSFSYTPLRLSSLLGFIFAGIAFILIIAVIILRFIFGFGITGWASTLTVILLIGGIQLITLGIIGEYLARIYDEVKNRPEYIISEKIGLGKNN